MNINHFSRLTILRARPVSAICMIPIRSSAPSSLRISRQINTCHPPLTWTASLPRLGRRGGLPRDQGKTGIKKVDAILAKSCECECVSVCLSVCVCPHYRLSTQDGGRTWWATHDMNFTLVASMWLDIMANQCSINWTKNELNSEPVNCSWLLYLYEKAILVFNLFTETVGWWSRPTDLAQEKALNFTRIYSCNSRAHVLWMSRSGECLSSVGLFMVEKILSVGTFADRLDELLRPISPGRAS